MQHESILYADYTNRKRQYVIGFMCSYWIGSRALGIYYTLLIPMLLSAYLSGRDSKSQGAT